MQSMSNGNTVIMREEHTMLTRLSYLQLPDLEVYSKAELAWAAVINKITAVNFVGRTTIHLRFDRLIFEA